MQDFMAFINDVFFVAHMMESWIIGILNQLEPPIFRFFHGMLWMGSPNKNGRK